MFNTENILRIINAPLGFFVLSLLIIESVFGISLASNISPDNKYHILFMGGTLFLVVIIIVSLLVAFRSENLVYTETSHLKAKGLYGHEGSELDSNELSAPTIPETTPLTGVVDQ